MADNNGKNGLWMERAFSALVIAALAVIIVIGILLPLKFLPKAISSLANTFHSLILKKESEIIAPEKTTPDSTENTGVVNTPTNSNTTPTETQSKTVNLSASIVSLGTVNKTTGAFVAGNPGSANDRWAISFRVTNTGSGTSPSWIFYAALPTKQDSRRLYTSPTQSPIAPQSSVQYVLSFDDPITGGNAPVTISVDPNNAVRETNESDNIISTSFPAVVDSYTYTPIVNTNSNTRPDFSIKIISTGYINRVNNNFVETSSIPRGNTGAVIFEVTNTGYVTSGEWIYSLTAPNSSTAYTSAIQSTLASNETRRFTATWNTPDSQMPENIYLEIDPQNKIFENNETNNKASVAVSIY